MNTPDALKVICFELSKQFQKIRKTPMHEFLKHDDFDVINDKNGLYLVTLVGTDGNNDHCVAIWDNLIFDCNEQFALIRNINNLNRCCSTQGNSVAFCKCGTIALFKIRRNNNQMGKKKKKLTCPT